MYQVTSVCRGGGYKYCRTDPPHPQANSKGLYPLHRVLAENKLGRPLRPGEEVHHRDEDKGNDDPDNLAVLTKADHARTHHPESPTVRAACTECGGFFWVKAHILRQRQRRNLGGRVFCSRVCATSGTH